MNSRTLSNSESKDDETSNNKCRNQFTRTHIVVGVLVLFACVAFGIYMFSPIGQENIQENIQDLNSSPHNPEFDKCSARTRMKLNKNTGKSSKDDLNYFNYIYKPFQQ